MTEDSINNKPPCPQSEKNYKVCYAVVSIAAVVFMMIADVTFIAYKRFGSFTMLAVTLYFIAPIIVSILSYIKITMQKRVPVRFSRMINIIVIALFMIGIIAFYHPWGLIAFISNHTMTTFVFCLQLWALAQDLFFRREQE